MGNKNVQTLKNAINATINAAKNGDERAAKAQFKVANEAAIGVPHTHSEALRYRAVSATWQGKGFSKVAEMALR